MIEKIVQDYLESKLEIPAYMEEDQDMPKEYVLIEKTGGGSSNHIKSAVMAIQSFSASMYGAARLNEKVKEVMEEIIELDDISKCELDSDYNFTDTSRKKYRYQAVFDITHY